MPALLTDEHIHGQMLDYVITRILVLWPDVRLCNNKNTCLIGANKRDSLTQVLNIFTVIYLIYYRDSSQISAH